MENEKKTFFIGNNFLANADTDYRKTTGQLNQLIGQRQQNRLKEFLAQYNNPEVLVNTVYFEQTGYSRPSWKEINSGDFPGPTFDSNSNLHEWVDAVNGIRLLGIALQEENDAAVKFLVEQGARIPVSSEGFPKGDDIIPPCRPAEYHTTVPAFSFEVDGERKEFPQESLRADSDHLLYEYKLELKKYLERAKDDLDERKQVVSTLGINPGELAGNILHPHIAKEVAKHENVTNLSVQPIAAVQRQWGRW
jgi:hypothetical protein